MSTLVPPILPTHTPSSYLISSAFLVCFPAFPHKRNNNIILPAAKKEDKPERNTILSRSFAVRIHKRTNILPPNLLYAHKRCNKRDNDIFLLLSFRIRKEQYIIPLCTVYLCERHNIMSPLIFAAFPRIFHKRSNILPPLIHFHHLSERDNILSPSCTICLKTA